MSQRQGCNDDSDVIERFTEALKQRVGGERFQIWFSSIQFECCRNVDGQAADPSVDAALSIVAIAGGQFAADRLSKHYLSEMRGAAAAACGKTTNVRVQIDTRPVKQAELPLEVDGETSPMQQPPPVPTKPVKNQRRGKKQTAQSLHQILRDGTDSRKSPRKSEPKRTAQITLDTAASSPDRTTPPSAAGSSTAGSSGSHQSAGGTGQRDAWTWENFIAGSCNELARTACRMAIESPSLASPLVLWGPPGSGKSHLVHAVAGKLRSLHRMRRVVYLTAEEFTNDFIKALNGNCLPTFRMRFRDADALLIDDIQFFVDKKATIRELHHTIEMLADAGKSLLFAGTKAPTEIKGLGSELSGRLASGLVCQVQSLDTPTRKELLSRQASSRCQHEWTSDVLEEIAAVAEGDGRVLSGIVNLVNLLQRMHGRMPTIEEIRQHGGHLLRATGVPITLSAIERAVEKTFQLDSKSLQSGSQTKSITEPRMLAMYLSREMTSRAFSEIGGHFGGRSHSTAILASQRVRQWLECGRSIGRGRAAISAQDAIDRIESVLKTG